MIFTEAVDNLLLSIGEYAANAGEDWRLDNPNIMDSYQRVAELFPVKNPTAWTEEWITNAANKIAAEVAINCRSAPQLIFPFIYLGLKDLLEEPEE